MLLKTETQFIKVIPTAASGSFEDMETYLESAEYWIKKEILGVQLYNLLDTASDDHTELLGHALNVIALKAYYEGIPFLDLTQTANGFAVVKNATQAPASKERVAKLRTQTDIRRGNETEVLIEFLEDHPDYHDEWKGALAYSLLTDCLIQSTRELKRFASWNGNREDFMKLKPDLIAKTALDIEPIISKDFIDLLIEQRRDNELTVDNIRVLEMIQYALGALVGGNPTQGKRLLDDVVTYLDKNLGLFSVYASSSEYTERQVPGYQNTQDSPIFVFGG